MKITRLTIREYAESLAIAFVLAMIIRHYAVEAFRIPTSSMEPTLIGSESHGDRILVSKFQYDLHPPQQWDIIVFKIDQHRINFHRGPEAPRGAQVHPNGTITHLTSADYLNYVKRLVGLPGQTILIRNGDVFINGRISRKPARVQNALFVPVTSDDILESRGETFADHWGRQGNEAVAMRGGVVTFRGASSHSACEITYLGQVEDRIETDERTTREREQDGRFNIVGDLKLAFGFTHLGGAGHLTGHLIENGTTYTFYLPLGRQGETAALLCDGDVVMEASEPFEASGAHRLEFSNVDARITLEVDGRVLIRFDNDTPSEALASEVPTLRRQTSGVRFGANRCDVTVRDVRLWRDIFYTSPMLRRDFGVTEPFMLGSDEYFVMGDNSPNSFDSRHWGVVRESSLIGEAFFVFWPITHWNFIN